MTEKLFYAAIAVFVIGALLFFKSNKTREAGAEWSNQLQWGYLLMMIGVFGILAKYMSFTAVLLIFTLFTGVVWCYEKISQSQTRRKVKAVVDQAVEGEQADTIAVKETAPGHFVDYMSGFFFIILVVFLLRSFVAEPFQIPSSSMRPGLVVGDFILVNKFSYGLRMPITNQVIVPVDKVERGDVVVFNFPPDPSINYIKRVVGVGGDTVEYRDKELFINGKKIEQKPDGMESYLEPDFNGNMHSIDNRVFDEQIGQHHFKTFQIEERAPVYLSEVSSDYPYRENCQYSLSGFVCKVPEGHYFMMGDNRDNSGDSRYWGFVDDKLIVGKAFLVWMNFSNFSRVGTKIQ